MMRLMCLQRVCHHAQHAPTRPTRPSPSRRAAPALTSLHSPPPVSAAVCTLLDFYWNANIDEPKVTKFVLATLPQIVRFYT